MAVFFVWQVFHFEKIQLTPSSVITKRLDVDVMFRKAIDNLFALEGKEYQEKIKFYALINCFSSAVICIAYMTVRLAIRTGFSLPTIAFCSSIIICIVSVIDLKKNTKINRFLYINLTNGYAIAVCNNIFSGGFSGTNGTFIWALIIVIVGIIYFDGKRVRRFLMIYVSGFILLTIYQFFFQQNPAIEFTGDMGHYAMNLLGFGFLVYSTFSIFVKDLINALNHAKEDAQHSAKAKSDFLSQMSHEIRSPLNAVIGMVQIAQRNKDNPERVMESLGTIDNYSKHLLRVINDILDYSKLDSHKLELDNESFSLAQNVEFLRSMLEPQAVKKGVAFEVCKTERTEEYIIGDQLRLNQILINLLSNAVKFTKNGGTVLLLIKAKSCEAGVVT